MNKLIIPIIAILIITAGISGYFLFQKLISPQYPISKCGDGICDANEKISSYTTVSVVPYSFFVVHCDAHV